MDDITAAILDAWSELGDRILADPLELAKRLARRRCTQLQENALFQKQFERNEPKSTGLAIIPNGHSACAKLHGNALSCGAFVRSEAKA